MGEEIAAQYLFLITVLDVVKWSTLHPSFLTPQYTFIMPQNQSDVWEKRNIS